jgi:hypothetical protein
LETFINWAIFPSGNSTAAQICAEAWKAAGWRVAVLIDDDQPDVVCDWLIREPKYSGTGASFNKLLDAIGDWQIAACVNDDMFPTHCTAKHAADTMRAVCGGLGTNAVLQPVKEWFDAMQWCAPCPIIGREYGKRVNGGAGPWWPGYRNYFVDQEFRDVAIRNGCYYECKDLGIKHCHHTLGFPDTLPPEKRKVNRMRHKADEQLYRQRLVAGFPGSGL